MRRLRAETRTWHTALEHTRFNLELLSGTLPLSGYLGQLMAYRIILDTLETRLTGSTDPVVADVWRPELAKVPLLDWDLASFDTAALGAVPAPALDPARRFAARIGDLTDPIAALGFLYVMEGSTMGGLMLAAHVRATFGFTGARGVSYYSCGDRERWAAFAARMDAAVVDEAQQRTVLAAADDGYRDIADTLAALSVPGRKTAQPTAEKSPRPR